MGAIFLDANVRGPRVPVNVKVRFKLGVFVCALVLYSYGAIRWMAEHLVTSDASDLQSHAMPHLQSGRHSVAPTAARPVPLARQFRLENLVPRPGAPHPGGSCGIFKCFFPLASDPGVGYLVAQPDAAADLDPVQVERNAMRVQWERGQHLSARYGLPHLMLAPPERRRIETAALAEYMSAHNSKRMGWKQQVFFNHSVPMDVQMLKVLPEPYALIGCMRGKRRHAEKTWGSFMASVNQDVFVPTFTRAIRRLETILDTGIKTGALAGALDFQGIVSNEGNIYLIDIALHPPEKDAEKARQNQQYEKDEQALQDCHKAFGKLLQRTQAHVDSGGAGSDTGAAEDEGRRRPLGNRALAAPEDDLPPERADTDTDADGRPRDGQRRREAPGRRRRGRERHRRRQRGATPVPKE